MEIFWFILAALLSGVIAGMGMGGGTLLIPVLTIFFNMNQHAAQGINLFAFIPCALVSLFIHIKNKLVDFKVAIPIIIVGVMASFGAAYLAMQINSETLQFLFGCFLLLIGIYQLITVVICFFRKKKKTDEKINISIRFFNSKMFK